MSLLGISSGLLTVAAFFPYIHAILRRETIPNPVSWWIWASVGVILAASYYSTGARAGLGVAIGGVCGQSFVAFLSLKYGTGKPRLLDVSCLFGAFAALLIWYLTSNPLLPHLMTLVIDSFAWFPTFQKTLVHPEQENAAAWFLWTAGAVLSLFVITQWNVAEVAYPVYLIVTESTVLFLILRKSPSSIT